MSNEEISVFRRLFPTKVVQWSLLALLSTPLVASELSELLPKSAILEMFSPDQLFTFSVFLVLVVSLLLIIVADFAFLFKETYQHRKRIHLDNSAPLLSWKWLAKNLQSKHWLVLAFLCLASAYLGFLLG